MIRSHLRFNIIRGIFFLFICIVGAAFPSASYAFEVEPLPDDNLVFNPWFRMLKDPTRSSLDGWTDAAGKDKFWSSSQKVSNPTPEIIVAGVCGRKKVFCGTAARLSPTPGQSGGLAVAEVDSYLYQVVAADPSNRKFKFFTHWVSHRVDVAEVTIYGSGDENGPWEHVWTPFSVQVDKAPRPTGNRADEWIQSDFESTVVTSGYPFYKIEIHVRFPESDQRIGDIGFKITGIYFATEKVTTADVAALTPTTTPTRVTTPTVEPTATRENTKSIPTLTEVLSPTPTFEKTEAVILNNQPEAQETAASTGQIPYNDANLPGVQSSNNPDDPARSNSFIAVLSAGLVFVVALVVILRMRRN